ncbi:MAG: lysophospholipid acyltransferase family protein [Bdellovibrionales bacterium]
MLVLGGLFLILCLVIGYKTTSRLGITWLWGKFFLWTVSARMVVKGREHIPKEGGAVFLFSHASYLDIPVLCASKGGQINFAAKSFLLDFPILGFIMRAVKAIVIYPDRERSIEQYKLAEERLKAGDSFMIAPEGGRSNGEELLPFKSGPFIFAMNAKADLVPVLIYGAHKLWPSKDKLPNLRKLFGTVHVEYFPKVSTADFTDDNRKEKAEEIRLRMLNSLKKLQA